MSVVVAQQRAGGLDLFASEFLVAGPEASDDLPQLVHRDQLFEGLGDVGGETAGPDVGAYGLGEC